jgi:2Fe-2S ferredoxin
VTVEPASLAFEAGTGETLLDAALKAGIRWPTVCKGVGSCKTCNFVIKSGDEHFSPMTALEKGELALIRRRYPGVPEDHVRLACQTTVSGDVVVTCKGVRSAPVEDPATAQPPADSAAS